MARQKELVFRFSSLHRDIQLTEWLGWILQAANSFVVKSVIDERSIIAGYHWFEAWGRDTFISLPGLTLVTDRFEDAKRILLDFARNLKNGLIPNFLGDKTLKPSYNTVDATLWYINAIFQYLKYTGDFEFIHTHLWEKLKIIIENHLMGTDFRIRMDNDGLLVHGPRLTWMDSQIDGKAVTPREGKAVEVQALWYNALRIMQLLANEFEERNLAETYEDTAVRTRKSFNKEFWNSQKNCLFDFVGVLGADASLRPNQIIAASLCFAIVDRDKAEKVVDILCRELLTPCGLRTLARFESGYKGVYMGERSQRDQAYHNGTVWPWLLGPLVTAYLRVEGFNDTQRKTAFEKFLNPLLSKQICQAGLGTINEIFDGDPPHKPRGCISQAWSVAEPLRAYVEDVLQIRPKFEKQIQQDWS